MARPVTVPGARRACSCCGGSGWVSSEGPNVLDALRSDALFLRRFLDQLVSVPVMNERGQIINRFAAAQIPDWAIRQQLEDIDSAIAEFRGAQCK